jgi:hypothetical protein
LLITPSTDPDKRIQIEVAAPYVVDSYNIFETAQIVFVQELPEQQKYRYGVRYLKSYSK